MHAVTRDEILPLGDYERVRPHFRARVIEAKRARRVRVSSIASLVFENHDTVLLQIQEMLRTERITSEDGIRHEIDTYNELVPGPGQLSATLFIEIADKLERDAMLTSLVGLERHLWLEVGERRIAALAAERTADGYERTTAVHYLKFDLDDEAREAVAAARAPVAIAIDHPAHQARVELGPETRRALAGDVAA